MKVKVTGHTAPVDQVPFWYVDHIGKEFEVVEVGAMPEYYLTEMPDSEHPHFIKKVDCEVVA